VTNLVAAFNGGPVETGHAMIACIGPKTADTARKAGLNVDVMAAEYTIPGLVAAIEERLTAEVN
jgi:uroporphyrinogen-III synthase